MINDFLLGDFSRSVYVQRAKELVPKLRERAKRQWAEPKILDETIADMQDAGFFQMLQPKAWGGAETSPIESFEVAATLGEADPSVAWVLGVVGIHAFHLAMFDERAQEEVWGKNTKTLIGSPYAPGKAVRVEGGFRLTGRWSFSSGSDHCDWTLLGAVVEGESIPAGPGVGSWVFLLPRKDYEIVSNWNVHGLRATGSNDIIVNDAFVPEYRTLKWEAVTGGTAPGMRTNTGLLFRLPFFQVFSRATTGPAALGALKGMVNTFIEYNSSRVSRREGTPTAMNPAATLIVAQCLTAIEEMKGRIYANYAALMADVEGRRTLSMDERRSFRFQSAQIPSRCAHLASDLYRITGGTAIYADQPFGRYLNDLMAIQTHGLNNYQPHANAWAGTLLGNSDAAKNYQA